MSTMNQCKVMKDGEGNPTGVIILPRAKMLYPNLWKPSARRGDPESKAKYGVTLLIPKEADLKPLIDAVNVIIAGKIGAAKTKVKKPFIKVTEEDQPKIFARLEAAGINPADFPIMLRCYTKMQPTVLAADKSKVEDETLAYEGRWCRASVRPYWYDNESKGVSCGLSNVQLSDEDEVIPRIGGSNAADEFEAVGSDDPFA